MTVIKFDTYKFIYNFNFINVKRKSSHIYFNTIFEIILFMLLIFYFLCETSYAMTDKEYKEMLSSSFIFSLSDSSLNEAYKTAIMFTNNKKNEIKKSQIEWIKNRDKNVKIIMDTYKISKIEAYTKINNERVQELKKISDKEIPEFIAPYFKKADFSILENFGKNIGYGEDSIYTLDKNGYSPFVYAVESNNVNFVKRIILKRKIDIRDRDQLTPLWAAAWIGNVEMARLLIENGADVNAQGTKYRNPLYAAILQKNVDMVRYLRSEGALLPREAVSILKGKLPVDMLDLMEKEGAFLATNDSVKTSIFYKLLDSNYEMKKFIDEYGMNKKDSNGQTILHVAIAAEKKESAWFLLALGIDANLKNTHGKTPLHIAAERGDHENMQCLLDHGADVQTTDEEGKTPLFFAALNGHLQCINLLYKYGTNLDDKQYNLLIGQIKDENKIKLQKNGILNRIRNYHKKGYSNNIRKIVGIELQTINDRLRIASEFGLIHECELLLKQGANPNENETNDYVSMNFAKDFNTVKILLEYGAHDIPSRYLDTRLRSAVSNNEIEIVKLLVANGEFFDECKTLTCDDGEERYLIDYVKYNKDKLKDIYNAIVNPKSIEKKYIVLSIYKPDILNSDGSSEIHICDDEKLKIYLEKYQNLDINKKDINGNTPLFYSDYEKSIVLLNHGADPNIRNNDDQTCIFRCKDKNKFKLLVDHGIDLNIKDKYGNSFVFYDHVDENDLDYYLKNNFNIYYLNKNGDNIFFNAVRWYNKKNPNILTKLMQLGIDPNFINKFGENAISQAYKDKIQDIKNIINKNFDKSKVDYSIFIFGDEINIRNYLNNGYNINTKNSNGITPLMIASIYGNIEAVKILIDSGASIDLRDNNGCTALYFAAGFGHEEIVNFLCQKGANPNSSDNNGRTPLHEASKYGHIASVEYLIKSGALMQKKDNLDHDPLDDTINTNYYSFKDESLKKILLDNKFIIFKIFLKNGYDINQAFLKATIYHGFNYIKYCIENGANINIRDDNGNYPLQIDVDNSHITIVKFLCEHGADPNLKNFNGETTLDLVKKSFSPYGANKDRFEIRDYLISKGAKNSTHDSNESVSSEVDSINSELRDAME